MKVWKLLLVACALSTSISVFASEPSEGIDRGNGGDEYSQEFVAIGYELVESLMKEPLAGVDAKALLQAVEGTKVKSTSQRLLLRGQEVSAINDPLATPPQILISQSAWDKMANETHRRVFLAFHEYLGIMGLDDSNYQISLRLDRARVCDRHPAIRSQIERELKKSCYRIVPDDLKYVEKINASDSTLSAISKYDFSRLDLQSLSLLEGTVITAFDFSVINRMKRMYQLFLGSSVSDLSNCSFLAGMPRLQRLGLSDSVQHRDVNVYRPVSEIAPGCFGEIGAKEFSYLWISIDGKNSVYRDFLRGIGKIDNVTIDGMNVDMIPVEEFIPLKGSSLNLVAYDNSLTDDYAKKVAAVIDWKCNVRLISPPRPNPPIKELTCSRYEQ